MNRILAILVAIMPFFASCEKNDTATERTITIDYALTSSGSMSRSASSLYSDFYTKYIATRKLTPSGYTLTFTNTADNSTVVVKDRWAANHALKLLTGTYKVTGASTPDGTDWNGGLDTLSLRFEEEINIDANTSSIKLNAIYDSFMIFFDAQDVKSIDYRESGYTQYGSELALVDNIYYLFHSGLAVGNYLTVNRTNGGTATVNIGKMTFEKGKYYYFGDTGTGFELAQMESGN